MPELASAMAQAKAIRTLKTFLIFVARLGTPVLFRHRCLSAVAALSCGHEI
jgi:hypothetical protein